MELEWHRGFIRLVRCPLAVWLDHGPDVVRLHPVTRVRLRDVFVIEHRGRWYFAVQAGNLMPTWLKSAAGGFDSQRQGEDALSGACLAWAEAASPARPAPA